MTPDHWTKIKNLLDRALARQPHEREEYLRHACTGDTELYKEVSALVATYDDSQAGKDEPAVTAPLKADRYLGRTVNNRYRIKSKLGSGGVGVVYLAEDLNLMSRLVVVKFLHDQGQTDQGQAEPGRLLKFLQEAEALARLDHPGIVSALDADETEDGSHFLVMQYVEGKTLRAAIQDGPLELRRIASILRQLGSALEAAHAKGVIHRDLKPENVMLQQPGSERETVKLIDFGVARVEASTVEGDTAIIGIAGTPSYMAPEHLSGKPGPASDIFSLGVIACEMLTGKRPFDAKRPFSLHQQHEQGVAKGFIRDLRPQAPEEAEAAIRECLRYQPAERPKNARVLCERIASLLEGAPEVPAPRNRRWLLKAGLAGVAAASAGAVIWRWRHIVPRAENKVLAHTQGALDPAEQGFVLADKMEIRPLRNEERSGFDRLSLQAPEQGMYYRRISADDLADAMRLGWKITLKGRPVIGGMWACADFRALGEPRFDVSFYREPDGRALALLCTQHAPTFEGPRYEMPDQGARRRLLELVYDPGTRTCELFVDGRRQVAGYKGYRQQQMKDPARAFFFGISVYRSQRAESEFETARFEIL